MTSTERIGNTLNSLKNQNSIRNNRQILVGQGFQEHNLKWIFPIFLNLCLVEQQALAEADG